MSPDEEDPEPTEAPPPPTPPTPQSGYTGPEPAPEGKLTLWAKSQAEEDAFDWERFRTAKKHSGFVGSTAHLVKGALGGGILSSHVAFMKGGLVISCIGTFIFGLYIGYSLYILVKSAHILYKRTRTHSMSYSDVGEASMAAFPNPKVQKWSKCFRYFIDFTICLDLFGACACYQLIIAKTIKQLVENELKQSLEGKGPGYPGIKVYLAAMIVPIILICWITHLKWLAPFSILANFFIFLCICVTMYYAITINPSMSDGVKMFTDIMPTVEFAGMLVFSMSCAGVVLPVTNNMNNTAKYPTLIILGTIMITIFVFAMGFFGYVAYKERCESPITVNFPMDILPKILKGLIAFMIYVTHALNFWVPFNLCFYYIKKKHNQKKIFFWELLWRSVFVVIIALLAILFPNINNLMGFLGAFCLSLMAFIWPNWIEILVIYVRPGFGKCRWRLWKSIFLMMIGFFLLIIGSYVNLKELFGG